MCYKTAWRETTSLKKSLLSILMIRSIRPQTAKFMWPTLGPPGSCRPQMGPMLAPWTLLSGYGSSSVQFMAYVTHAYVNHGMGYCIPCRAGRWHMACQSWWRNGIEKLSELLALCGEFTDHRRVPLQIQNFTNDLYEYSVPVKFVSMRIKLL